MKDGEMYMGRVIRYNLSIGGGVVAKVGRRDFVGATKHDAKSKARAWILSEYLDEKRGRK